MAEWGQRGVGTNNKAQSAVERIFGLWSLLGEKRDRKKEGNVMLL